MEPFILLIALIIYVCAFLLGHKIGEENAESTKIIERLWLELDDVYSSVDLSEEEKYEYDNLKKFLSERGYWSAPSYYNQTKEDKLRIKSLMELSK